MAMTDAERKTRRAELRFEKQFKAYKSAKGEMMRIWLEGAERLDSFETILENRSKLMASGTWQAMNYYQRAGCHGISDAMSDLVWKPLVWTHVLDGKRVLSRSFPDERLHDINTDESAHCYVTPEGKLMPFRDDMRALDKAAGRI
jgi:hypothetical protein